MSDNSGIEWTDTTWNPTTGCDRVSAGCDNCYALTLAGRLKAMGSAKYQNDGDPRTSGPGFAVTEHPSVLSAPLRWRKPRRVFVNSMSDLFHPRISTGFIADVFAVMARTPQHTYQVLTKRAPRMAALMPADPRDGGHRLQEAATTEVGAQALYDAEWPLPNVHLGVSVETQEEAEERIDRLVGTAAAVRWISAEPLLGPVDLTPWMPAGSCRWHCGGCKRFYAGDHQEVCPGCGRTGYWCGSHVGNSRPNGQPLNWVVAGGESGPDARPMHPDWARSLRDQCTAAGVPFFFKQWGMWAPDGHWGAGPVRPRQMYVRPLLPPPPRMFPGEGYSLTRFGTAKAAGRMLDGRTWDEYPTARR